MTLVDAIVVRSPFSLPAHFLGLELVVYIGFILTLRHAITQWRAGERYHLFQWSAVFIYGLIMELVSFNLFKNYVHGEFSVQFYYDQLPLYVTCIYLVFHYTGIKMVERLGLPRLQEAFVAGLAIMCMDVPFDTMGVDAGWWVWVDNSDNALHARFVEAVATRWFGVPVSSYLWYLMYGALLCLFGRTAFDKMKDKSTPALFAVAPLVATSVFVAGALCFEVVFWFPRSVLGVSDHAIVAAYMAIVVLFTLTRRAPNAKRAPPWLVAIPSLMFGFHVIVLVGLWSQGDVDQFPGKAGLIAGAIAVSFTILLGLPLRREAVGASEQAVEAT